MTKNTLITNQNSTKSNDPAVKKEADTYEEIKKQITRNGTTRHNLF